MSPGGVTTFVGRDAEIRQFETLVTQDSPRWVLLVDGLPGMGRRALIDTLRRSHSAAIPSARIELTPGTTESEIMRQLVTQVDAKLAAEFESQLAQLAADEGKQALVNYAPEIDMRASFLGSIREASQGNVTMQLGDLATVVQLDRRTRRLDLLERVLSQLRDRVWVLFVSGAEHLDEGPLQRFVLREMVPRLHARFPGFRLYLTGHTVPTTVFARSDYVSSTLGPFTRQQTSAFLEAAGREASETEPAYALTGGHPLLLTMYVEGVQARGKEVLANTPLLDDSARTNWIYDGIISTLPSESLRTIAPDLSTLDWFDLSLLRTLFDAKISAEDFQSLVRRSMIKALPNGRWRCHDLIRPHLAAQRAALDPAGTRALQRRAFAAYRERIESEEEREGASNFPDRLSFVLAALHSASAYSRKEAESFALQELIRGVFDFDEGYVYALARALDAPGSAAALAAIGQQARKLLEDVTVQKWSDDANALVTRLATVAYDAGGVSIAARMLHLATRSSLRSRRIAEALANATRAVAIEDSLESRLLLAEAQSEAGKNDDAIATMAKAREAFGDSAQLRVSEGLLANTLGKTEEAIRHFTEAVAAYPNESRDARLWLGFLLQSRGEHEQALAQADAVLAVEPAHAQASLLRLDSLAMLGRFAELPAQLERMSSQFAHFQNIGTSVVATFSDPILRGRLITALKVDPSTVPPPMIFALCEVLAMEGDVDAVDEWTAVAEKRSPETRELCEMKRATALLFAQRPAEAAIKFRRLIVAGTESWDVYFLLAAAHGNLGEGNDARAVLAQVAVFWPKLQDPVDERYAMSYVVENRAPLALAYLTEQAASRSLGPLARLTKARLLVGAEQVDDALEMLDYILHTDDKDALPITSAIEARLLYALLQLPRNRDAAVDEARTLEEWFKQATGIRAAATLYTALDDESGLQRLLRNTDIDARTRMVIIDGMSTIISKRSPSEDDLLEALRANPRRLEVAVSLIAQHLKSADAKSLVATMQRIEDVAPGLVGAWTQLTYEVLASASPRERDAYRAQTAQLGNTSLGRIGYAKILGTLGKISAEEAQAEFQAVALEDPDLADSCVLAESDMLIDLHLLDLAAQRLAPYIAMESPPEVLSEVIPKLYLQQKNNEAASAFSRRVAERFPSRRRSAQESVVDLLISDDKNDDALAMLATMAAEAPLTNGLRVSKANALGGLKRFDEALGELPDDDALRDRPDLERAMVLRCRGRWLRGANRLADSIAAYTEALAASPRDALARFGLAFALREGEFWSEAYDMMIEGIALAPSELATFEGDLRELREKREAARK
ncbi:MAG: tetratricopeptide repeat protein [bacterium]